MIHRVQSYRHRHLNCSFYQLSGICWEDIVIQKSLSKEKATRTADTTNPRGGIQWSGIGVFPWQLKRRAFELVEELAVNTGRPFLLPCTRSEDSPSILYVRQAKSNSQWENSSCNRVRHYIASNSWFGSHRLPSSFLAGHYYRWKISLVAYISMLSILKSIKR